MAQGLSDALLGKAAQLRAEGLSWEAVGRAVHRSAETVRRWPREHPSRWAAALKRAENEIVGDAAAESRNALRHQLRDENIRLSQSAAAALLKHQTDRLKIAAGRKKPAKAASATSIRMAEYVEGLSDADLERSLRELEESAGAAPDAAVDASRSPGPAEPERVP